MSFENRIAVITGATGGLGRVLAGQLAKQGASLALFSNDAENLARLAAELVAEMDLQDERIMTHVVDLSDPNSGAAALEATLAKFGRADILLHVVGGWTGGKTIVDFEVDAFAEMLQQHFWTTLHVLRAFAPHFVGNGWGRVVVVSSPLVAAPAAKNAPYIVAKSAQEALILSLAQEVKHTGVTANVVRVKAIDVKRQKLSEPSPANASWTTPEEISETILYLCSDQASMVNGARLPLYGSP